MKKLLKIYIINYKKITMSLIEKNQKSDIIEFDDKNYFFRIPDIYLENNEKINYINYLKTIMNISYTIKDFCLKKISNIYSEESFDGIVTLNIPSEIFDEINKINNSIIDKLKEYEKINTNVDSILKVIYEIINKYDIDYYINKAHDEWIEINLNAEFYLGVKIKLFIDDHADNKFNIFKLLFGSENNYVKSNQKRLLDFSRNNYTTIDQTKLLESYNYNNTEKTNTQKTNKKKYIIIGSLVIVSIICFQYFK